MRVGNPPGMSDDKVNELIHALRRHGGPEFTVRYYVNEPRRVTVRSQRESLVSLLDNTRPVTAEMRYHDDIYINDTRCVGVTINDYLILSTVGEYVNQIRGMEAIDNYYADEPHTTYGVDAAYAERNADRVPFGIHPDTFAAITANGATERRLIMEEMRNAAERAMLLGPDHIHPSPASRYNAFPWPDARPNNRDAEPPRLRDAPIVDGAGWEEPDGRIPF